MSWADIENAMQEAISIASDFPRNKVVWSYQDVDEPTLDHIRINFGGEMTIGIDRVHVSQDLNRPAGQEIEQRVDGIREVSFEIECFTSAVLGEAAARRVLEKTRTKIRLPMVRIHMRRAGVSPFDPGPVDYIPDIPSAEFRGRAICTVRCYVPVLDCIEYVGYIATVRGRILALGAASGFSGMSPSGMAYSQIIG